MLKKIQVIAFSIYFITFSVSQTSVGFGPFSLHPECLFVFFPGSGTHTHNSDHVSLREALENFLRALIQIMCSLTASISRLYRWNNKANPNRRAEISPLLPSHPRWLSAKSLQSYMWNTSLRANLTKRCKNILSKRASKGRAAPFWPQKPLSFFFFSLSLLLAVIYRTLSYTMYTKPGPASNLWAFVLKHCQPPSHQPSAHYPASGGCWVNTNAVFIPLLVWLRWECRQLAASYVWEMIFPLKSIESTNCRDESSRAIITTMLIRKLSRYWCRWNAWNAWQIVN